MVRKAAEKKQSSNNTQMKASIKKGTGKKKTVKKNVKKTMAQKDKRIAQLLRVYEGMNYEERHLAYHVIRDHQREAALERKESRGLHYMIDYPETDERYLKWKILQRDDGVQQNC